MSLNNTPKADRIHIGIFGRRNVGKSSVINAITGQDLAIVSDVLGTTTDPVLKTMELLPLGPVVVIDTPGLDDVGELGELRVKKTKQILNKTDIAVIVVDSNELFTKVDLELLELIRMKNIPFCFAINKSDEIDEKDKVDFTDKLEHEINNETDLYLSGDNQNVICVSAINNTNIWELKEMISKLKKEETYEYPIISDIIDKDDFVVLVIPIDSAAPKGRLILPQQQTIREILDSNAVAISVQTSELKETLDRLDNKVKMVVTDSQAFKEVAKVTPDNITLTSFSILFARHKGNLKEAVEGARVIETLDDGDSILITEGCTHHRQCDDIGTVKLPKWLRNYTGKDLNFEYTSGTEFPDDLSKYKLIIHCGGCTLNEREMKYRLSCAKDQNISMTNYGTAIAYMNGILERSIDVFKI